MPCCYVCCFDSEEQVKRGKEETDVVKKPEDLCGDPNVEINEAKNALKFLEYPVNTLVPPDMKKDCISSFFKDNIIQGVLDEANLVPHDDLSDNPENDIVKRKESPRDQAIPKDAPVVDITPQQAKDHAANQLNNGKAADKKEKKWAIKDLFKDKKSGDGDDYVPPEFVVTPESISRRALAKWLDSLHLDEMYFILVAFVKDKDVLCKADINQKFVLPNSAAFSVQYSVSMQEINSNAIQESFFPNSPFGNNVDYILHAAFRCSDLSIMMKSICSNNEGETLEPMLQRFAHKKLEIENNFKNVVVDTTKLLLEDIEGKFKWPLRNDIPLPTNGYTVEMNVALFSPDFFNAHYFHSPDREKIPYAGYKTFKAEFFWKNEGDLNLDEVETELGAEFIKACPYRCHVSNVMLYDSKESKDRCDKLNGEHRPMLKGLIGDKKQLYVNLVAVLSKFDNLEA